MSENISLDAVRNVILNTYLRNSNLIISRYYNDPPNGGHQVNEEHEYILPDSDDISSIAIFEILTRCENEKKLFFNPKKTIKLNLKKIKENDCLIDSVCSICLDNYKKNEYYRTLDCKHVFHKKCIDVWLKKDHLNCPMCRSNIKI